MVQIIKTTGSSGLGSTERGSCVEDAASNLLTNMSAGSVTAGLMSMQVKLSMYDLYQADYRLRIYVAGFFLRRLADWEKGQIASCMVTIRYSSTLSATRSISALRETVIS